MTPAPVLPPRTARLMNPQEREIYEALGEMVVEFAYLEESLHIFFQTALGVTQAAIMTGGMNFSTLVGKLEPMFSTVRKPPTDSEISPDEVSVLCKELADLNVQRNNMIHSYWGVNWETGNALRLKRLRRPTTRSHEGVIVSPIEIRNLTIKCDEAARKVWAYLIAGVPDSEVPQTPHGP